MARGRLIFPFLLEIARLDTVATEADPDAAGPLESGYDEVFREPVLVPSGGSQTGTLNRVETIIEVRGQFEPGEVENLNALISGNSPVGQLVAYLHFKELEDRGLLDPNGQASFKTDDRLVSIKELNGDLVQQIPDPPGLYVQEVSPRGWGLGPRPKRNLLRLVFEPRLLSTRG